MASLPLGNQESMTTDGWHCKARGGLPSMTASEPRFLSLETSGRVGQVALAEGDQVRGVRRLDEARRHARDLAPAVKDLLDRQGWRPRDLQAVIVSRGPGSYT